MRSARSAPSAAEIHCPKATLNAATPAWAAVHRLDAARLIRLAVESAPAGSRLHAVAEEGTPVRDIAGIIGKQLQLPITSVAPDAVMEHFGWLGAFFSLDAPASSQKTREQFDWEPAEIGLLDDLAVGHYF
ncbi:hypothetical protein [Mycolicibacterium sp.]|uniref:hypothetical protein n=1 Tax=Mycolicibacterium sp. TaxID=2320850 RepID=UPI0037CAD67F